LADSLGISFDIQTPLLLVVKKNTTVLKRLNTWLLSQTQEINGEKRITNKSLLIIDDEADNASINTKKADEVPTANQWMDTKNRRTFLSLWICWLHSHPICQHLYST